MTDKLREAAQAIVDRWDSPAWGGSAENLRHTGEYIAELRAALAQQEAQAVPQGWIPPSGLKVADIGFRWDGDALQHVPHVLVEFEPVPANLPNTEKGWADRDAFVEMLNAAPTPPAQRVMLTDDEIMQKASEAGLNLEPTRNMLIEVRGQHAQLVSMVRSVIREYERKNGIK